MTHKENIRSTHSVVFPQVQHNASFTLCFNRLCSLVLFHICSNLRFASPRSRDAPSISNRVTWALSLQSAPPIKSHVSQKGPICCFSVSEQLWNQDLFLWCYIDPIRVTHHFARPPSLQSREERAGSATRRTQRWVMIQCRSRTFQPARCLLSGRFSNYTSYSLCHLAA